MNWFSADADDAKEDVSNPYTDPHMLFAGEVGERTTSEDLADDFPCSNSKLSCGDEPLSRLSGAGGSGGSDAPKAKPSFTWEGGR